MRTSASRLVQGGATRIWVLGFMALLVMAAPASGAKLKHLGRPAQHVGQSGTCGSCNELQLGTAPSSPSYVVPRGHWTIVSWKAHGNHDGRGKAQLRIYRPTNVDGQYKLVKESDVEGFPAGEITKHKAHIRVRKGDHLGLTGVGAFATVYESGKPADLEGGPACGPYGVGTFVGTSTACPLFTAAEDRVNVAVTLKRRG
jgi:hypothetical protein